jgi:uncharacterized protein (TIGR02246 family)
MTELATLARSYFDKVRARDAEAIAAMFAEGGVLVLPYGAQFDGPEAIAAFYRDLFAKAPPTPEVTATLTEGRRCLVQLVARQADGAEAHAADVFTFDADGRIAELVIYTRKA